MRTLHLYLLASLAVGVAAAAAWADSPGALYALFYDGSCVTVPSFPKDVWWSDETTVAGRRLFGTLNPVRMLQDMSVRASRKGPRVVMANGDVLPGKIAGFLPASPDDDTPARLLIAPDGSLITADPRGVAVRADEVLRVRTAAEDTHAGSPGAMVLTDGTRLTATALRWSDQGLKALTERGLTAVAFDAIGELDIPHADAMRPVLDDAFYPPSGRAAVIGRLETVDGAVLTYRCQMTLVGITKASALPNRGNSTTPYLAVQPNWSTTVLFVPGDSIWRESFRAANEVPLSLLPAKTLSEKVGVHRWPWRRNENVEGGTLVSGSFAVDLGIGTHACCEIAFDLPPQAREFTSLVGLERRMGSGACACGKVYADQVAGRPLYAGGFLRGGQEPNLVGPLRVAGCRKLVLVTEWAGDDGPAGAFPLDIGGHVDWLMPLVSVEADDASYCQSVRRFVPGWSKWDLGPADARRMRIEPYWDNARECWLPAIYVVGVEPLTIQRKLSPVSSANDLLELMFAHPSYAPLPKIELRVDGALVAPSKGQHADSGGELEPLPKQSTIGKPAALKGRLRQTAGRGSIAETAQNYRAGTMRWDLQKYHGRAVQLTLSISVNTQTTGLVWRELATRKGKP